METIPSPTTRQEIASHRGLVGLLIVLLSLLLRNVVGFHPYSGEAMPPMYGDYEAQRHWMELTTALPVKDWYTNTTDNDLQYWGLDYPPLTAYHSWLCGIVGHYFIPEAFALHASRGFESVESKIFMRGTVLVADVLVYIPACFLGAHVLLRCRHGGVYSLQEVGLTLLLSLHPALLLIDHGHFQYNGVSLGLALLAVAAVATHRPLIASALFSAALNYKQMLLYYSPAFFCFLLANSLRGRSLCGGIGRVALIGSVVLGTFALLWAPWLLQGVASTRQLLHRLFPFERGLFEDKVANLWCSMSLVYKAHLRHSRAQLQLASTVLTLLGFLPCSLHLLRFPTLTSFLYALVITSLSFFQFSFQVHEKNILMCTVPACLLLALGDKVRSRDREWLCFVVGHLTLVALFSMFPLLRRDQLAGAYLAVGSAYGILYYCALCQVARRGICLLAGASTVGMVFIHLVAATNQPPVRYPDLFTYAFTVYSYSHILAAYILLNVLQWRSVEPALKVE
eukprot:GGOE01018821.1.p1 GENE.GGOE01018821.1~~GGOE01018821.1.p1  ORF type:complete len:510 (-),score=135.54 GGOE01018821.1:321-1850(-)